jgi:hypothetical protein
MVVSSANKIGAEVLFKVLGISFIYNRSNRRTRTEPYGTP